jgi:hypothetical protein
LLFCLFLDSLLAVEADAFVSVAVALLREGLFAVAAGVGAVVEMNFDMVLKVATLGEAHVALWKLAQKQLATPLRILVK